ncbi:MAG TPA: SPFH domain-containing protein [Clostridiales bacterium]|nr:SPFH domain-containing protein [Clostridiales bacterium]
MENSNGVSTPKQLHYEEIPARYAPGMLVLVVNIIVMLIAIVLFVYAANSLDTGGFDPFYLTLLLIGILFGFIICPLLFAGLKILQPNEALVLTIFGKYYGTLKGAGFYFVNPFCIGVNPAAASFTTAALAAAEQVSAGKAGANVKQASLKKFNKKISLKSMTLNNEKQKINDELGNPIIIGIVVIWRVVNTAKAAFNVDDYVEYLSIQCDSSLRNIVRLYPYDAPVENGEKSLRGSSQEVADMLKAEIQTRVDVAGLEIIEARITHLAYAPEIAAAMLQRQQASAIIAARQMIVEGAVGMVDMALTRLSTDNIVDLDEERKASMVSNLLVVLCSNKETQPIVNSGSIY